MCVKFDRSRTRNPLIVLQRRLARAVSTPTQLLLFSFSGISYIIVRVEERKVFVPDSRKRPEQEISPKNTTKKMRKTCERSTNFARRCNGWKLHNFFFLSGPRNEGKTLSRNRRKRAGEKWTKTRNLSLIQCASHFSLLRLWFFRHFFAAVVVAPYAHSLFIPCASCQCLLGATHIFTWKSYVFL